MVTLIRSDLDFILDQIIISERHAAGESLTDILPNIELPWGVRTVDGTYNNLLPGQEEFGAADTTFPRTLDPNYINEGDDGMRFGPPIPGLPGDPALGIPPGYQAGVNWLGQNDYGVHTPNDPNIVGQAIQPGDVVDADPRMISRLIVDQTVDNPAAVLAALKFAGIEGQAAQDALAEIQADPAAAEVYGIVGTNGVLVLPNVAPDEGLSAPFNSWMTLFGQFFDHGLDLVAKGGWGTVYIPLAPDDPLIAGDDGIFGNSDDLPSQLRFMAVTRSTLERQAGEDGILGNDDDTYEATNLTTPFVDQNQTYTSHPSMQVFHREYELRFDATYGADVPKATGGLHNGVGGGLATWADVKEQARVYLGIELDDQDILNGPQVLTDEYGNFIPGANGFPQLVTANGLVEGDPGNPVNASDAFRTGHAFLDDIAHNANPAGKTADTDEVVGLSETGAYDNELLDAHFITGDGRGNENIGLTTVHHVFHSEHNRMLQQIKDLLVQDIQDQIAGVPAATPAEAIAFINAWLDPAHQIDVGDIDAQGVLLDPQALVWNGERLFQAAKLPTEMQYQHLVFEEFARKVQPFVNVFNDYDAALNPAILAEFAHTVYRFGHSMLNETVDLYDTDTGELTEVGLIEAFLNPLAFHQDVNADGTVTSGLAADPDQAAALIIQGMTRQRGNAIDEFVTDALHDNLLGLPLDLAAINIARGRETGVPTLNAARSEFFAGTNDSQLKPYESWLDFALNLKNPTSVINFIAAYGTHDTITDVDTLDAKRDAAMKLVFGGEGAPEDRIDFLNATGDWAPDGVGPNDDTLGGLNNVDFWIGGLAEKTMIFGGMLGSTFNFVFETQLEALQNGDRFYYLNRLANLNLTAQLENNKFSEMIHRNTDAYHLPGDVFSNPDYYLEVDQSKQHTGIENSATAVDVLVNNGTFEAQSLASDGPGGVVNEDALRGNYTFGSPTGWQLTGTGGTFDPTDFAITGTGHGGTNVAWLTGGAMLAQNTGQTLVEGRTYTVTFNAGDRSDQPGLATGVARLIATNGLATAVLAEVNLSLTDAAWTEVSLSSGPVDPLLDGFQLRIEIVQGGGGNQILVDDVQLQELTSGPLNGDPINEDPFLQAITPLVIRRDLDGNLANGQEYLRFTGAEHVVLGGSEGDDHLIAGLGDDTVWGDGGNDTIEGGQGNDLIFGGDGNDIITDDFGDDEIRSGAGNDAVMAGPGLDLIITDTGSDWVVGGNDGVETLAGQGNDFVFAGTGSDFVIGGEGNDWLEGGGENNLLLGDNGDLVQGLPIKRSVTSNIEGHDVLLSSDGNEDFDAEQGDDIMVGGLGTDRFFGQFGYDWATYFTDPYGLEADMNVRLFAPPPTVGSPASILDRYAQTEALSGSQFGDILRGDDETDLGAGGVDGLDNVLLERNLDLIDGLREMIEPIAIADRTDTPDGGTPGDLRDDVAFSKGNILLGGDGSDVIEGRGGNDIIDGDKWLNVRLEFDYNNTTHTTDRMLSTVDGIQLNGKPASLSQLVFAGLVDPGNISIVREIVNSSEQGDPTLANFDGDFDTVMFSDVRANYTIEGDNTLDGIRDVDGDGFIRVSHDSAAGLGDGLGIDGVDHVANVERLQFADDQIVLGGVNAEPQGQPLISGVAAVGQTLTVVGTGISDGDGIPGVIDFFWEVDLGTGFEPVTVNIADELVAVRGPSFEVTEDLAGFPLRVRAQFRDGNGVLEQVFSEPTAIVANEVATTPTIGNDVLIGTANADLIDALAGDDTVFGLGGADTLIGGAGNDILDGGAEDDVAQFFGPLANFQLALDVDGNLEVLDLAAGEEDVLIDVETIEIFNNAGNLAATVNAVAARETLLALAANPATDPGAIDILRINTAGDFVGTGADNVLAGTANAETIRGQAGNDQIFGLGGNDIIIGGAGDDEIFWNVGDGTDIVNGGSNPAGTVADVDVFNVTGTGVFRVVAVTGAGNGGNRADVEADFGTLAAGTEIVIIRQVQVGNTLVGELIAQLNNIEELVINGADAPVADPNNPGQAVQSVGVVPIGNFTPTSLALATITVNGTSGDDSVDISGLMSAHRIVFRSNGGNDTVVGNLRPQDVVEVAPGMTPDDYGAPVYNGNNTWTMSQTGGGHSITYAGGPSMTPPTFAAGSSSPGNGSTVGGLAISASELVELKKLALGQPSALVEDDATGVRDLEGTGNNREHPEYGSADEPFIRLTNARYGEYNETTTNYDVNPIFSGLDPRAISDALGVQTDPMPNSAGANLFFMAFGQYFDHGLDFLPKSSDYGMVTIDGVDQHGPGAVANFADLTRGAVNNPSDVANGALPEHLNKTSPFVDQNQAYGSTELVGQLLRDRAPDGSLGAHLLAGADDPHAPGFKLLPTLREVLQYHWDNNSTFFDPEKMDQSVNFREYFTDYPIGFDENGVELKASLIDANGAFDARVVKVLNADFMNSGHTLVGDANRGIDVLDHFVAGDLRANENYTLTSIHTIWARNHNFHVEQLEQQYADAGIAMTADQIFEVAKIINEAEYQRVVFTEFADKLFGGLKGSGSHGHDEYNPEVNAQISHEFAAAVYRVGHSLISETVSVFNPATGQMEQVPLTSVFLNPTNDAYPPGTDFGPYTPAPGYKQLGTNPILQGITAQHAEEVDFSVVDAVRDDLVRIRADLFAFNVARGWDVGLGTLNQVKADLLASNDPYIKEAVELSGADLTPYSSWEDFRQRNGLSTSVLNAFMAAYPDLRLQTQEEVDAFVAANGDDFVKEDANGKYVAGIDRVDLWVGGLAETHINDGMVGATFWVVLHEQFDRLQEGDRFYYLDRLDDFEFYQQIDDQSFSDIVARNTGLEGLPEDIFEVSDEDTGSDTGSGDGEDDDDTDQSGSDTSDDTGDETGDDTDTGTPSTGDNDNPAPGNQTDTSNPPVAAQSAVILGDTLATTMNDTLVGSDQDETIMAGDGDDSVMAGSGNDQIVGGAGTDVLFGGAGDDMIIDMSGDTVVLAGEGNDHIILGSGADMVLAGAGDDIVTAGQGNDVFLATDQDGDDVYDGGGGTDTLDLTALSSGAVVDLGAAGFGSAISAGSNDTLVGVENVIGTQFADTIIAGGGVNELAGMGGDDVFVFTSAAGADGDHILDFQAGDTIDVSGIAAAYGFAGGDFELLAANQSFTAAGQLIVRSEDDHWVVEGNVDDDLGIDFAIKVSGKSQLDASDFNGV